MGKHLKRLEKLTIVHVPADLGPRDVIPYYSSRAPRVHGVIGCCQWSLGLAIRTTRSSLVTYHIRSNIARDYYSCWRDQYINVPISAVTHVGRSKEKHVKILERFGFKKFYFQDGHLYYSSTGSAGMLADSEKELQQVCKLKTKEATNHSSYMTHLSRSPVRTQYLSEFTANPNTSTSSRKMQ